MDYKSAVTVEAVEQKEEPKMIKLTNPFKYEKVAPPFDQTQRFFDIVIEMRQRWEAYHDHNGTWYDYSDDGSWYSDEEEEEEEEVKDDEDGLFF